MNCGRSRGDTQRQPCGRQIGRVARPAAAAAHRCRLDGVICPASISLRVIDSGAWLLAQAAPRMVDHRAQRRCRVVGKSTLARSIHSGRAPSAAVRYRSCFWTQPRGQRCSSLEWVAIEVGGRRTIPGRLRLSGNLLLRRPPTSDTSSAVTEVPTPSAQTRRLVCATLRSPPIATMATRDRRSRPPRISSSILREHVLRRRLPRGCRKGPAGLSSMVRLSAGRNVAFRLVPPMQNLTSTYSCWQTQPEPCA